MNFSEFMERVLEEIQDYLPAEYENAEITTTKILKENVERTGLNIRKPGETLVPTLHLEAFYEDYQKSEDFEETLNKIVKARVEVKQNLNIDVESLTKWDEVKEQVVPALINAEKNKKLLENLVHKKLGDMAIIYKIVFEMAEGEYGTTKVTHGFLAKWGITGKELYEQAIENIKRKFKGDIFDINELFPIPGIKMPTMFVLTDNNLAAGPVGAAHILNTDLLDRTAEMLGRSQIVLIPSSRWEMLAVSTDLHHSEIKQMIGYTNTEEVKEEDILSYISFFYDTKTKEIKEYTF